MTEGVDETHEAAVEQFLEDLKQRDPDRVEEVERKFPVLTEAELAWRRSREVRLTDKFSNTVSLCADIFGRRLVVPIF